MRVVIKGNKGKRMSWFKEHEFQIWTVLCAVIGMAVLITAWIIK